MNKNTGITVRLEPRQAPNPPERSRRGTGWRNAAGALVAALSLASAGTLLADETFQDDTFAETPAGPWSEDGPYSVPDGGSFTFEQVATGGQGDDGPYGRVAVNYQTVSSGQTVTWGFIFNDQFVIDPAVDGEIDRVSAEWIARETPGVISGHAMMLAVRQDGLIWAALDGRPFSNNVVDWTPFSQTQLTEAGFTLNSAWAASGQAATPDFSASGSPITFGLGFGASCPSSSDCTPQPDNSTDIDALTIEVFTTAAPNAGTLSFASSEYTVDENTTANSVTVTVERSGGTQGAVSVDYASRDVTAIAGTDATNGDYRATSGTLDFADGDASLTIQVEIFDDTEIDSTAEESFAIDLSNATGGAVLGAPDSTTVVITDDESVPMLVLDLVIDDLNEDDPDIGAADITDPGSVTADLGTVAEPDEKFAVYALVDNPGDTDVTDVTIVFRLEKTALAAYEISTDCSVDAASDAQAVIVTCANLTFPATSTDTAVPGLPTGTAPAVALFTGYAATTSDGNTYTYSAEITAATPATAVPTPALVEETLTITNPSLPPGIISNDGDGIIDCFIATAAYGSVWEPNVQLLRDFRDRHLQTNAPGRWFVRTYYRLSPPVAAWISQRDWARAAARAALTPLVTAIRHPLESLAVFVLVSGALTGRRIRRRTAGNA